MSTRGRIVFVLVVALVGAVAVLAGVALDASGRIKAREAAEKAKAEAAAAPPRALDHGGLAGDRRAVFEQVTDPTGQGLVSSGRSRSGSRG